MPSQAIPLPAPYKGQNDLLPLFSIQSPFCERLQNFDNVGGVLKLRKGNAKWCTVTGNALYLHPYLDKLFLVVDPGGASGISFYDVTSGTPSLVYTAAGTGGDDEIHSLYFNGYLFFFGEFSLSGAPVYYNGTAWGAAGYTWPASFNPFGGCVFKNRAYFVGRQSNDYAYSGIDSISGATTKVSLGGLVSSNAQLYAIRPLTAAEATTPDAILAFLFSNGDILAYSGSYPNSESWGLVARLKVSKLVYNNAYIEAKGDTFIFTESEILSLRNLFSGGYSQERQNGIGAAINNRWKQVVKAILDVASSFRYFIRGVYDEVRDRLVISLPFYVDPTTSEVVNQPFQLIYDFAMGAWFEYYQTGGVEYVASAAYFDNVVWFLAYYVSGTESAIAMRTDYNETYLDDIINTSGSQGIPFLIKSAPHPLSRYGVVRTDGLEVLIKSGMFNQVNYKLIGDLGAQTTESQTTVGSGILTDIVKTFANIGIESNLVQYEISGTSALSTVGVEIYGTNLWIVPSSGVSR